MPLALKLRVLLAILRLVFGKSAFHGLTVESGRKRLLRMAPNRKKRTPLSSVVNRMIPGPGGEIPVRIYMPDGKGPFPLLGFFHGGGFVLADLDTEDELCRILCRDAGCAVVSVGYRLAPEHKFPAASDDCLAAIRWAAEHATEFNADPARIALSGDSAGGNLAAVTALRIRDEGGPPLRGQLLVYPITAYHTPPSESYLTNANGYGLTRDDMVWFWSHYLRDEAEASNSHAAPLRAPDLSNLPAALVITAEYDPLRDEGERYAERLRAAGTSTVLSRYDGMIHGFIHLGGLVDESRRAVNEAVAWLQKVLAVNGK